MEATRLALTSADAPLGFWPWAVDHAVDILSRTTGPPNSSLSAYELLTGDRPKVMGIYPFGCRMYAVRPATSIRKQYMETHAVEGIIVLRLAPTAPQSSLHL